MFIHNIDPVLFSIGPIEVRYYSLAYIIGFILVYYLLHVKRDELKLNKDQVEAFVLYLMIGVLIGARLFEVLIWNPGYYFANPFEIIAFWHGGMSFHGGLVGAIVVGYWFARKYKIPMGKLADILVLPALFALALGRIANFINAELVGTITNLRWCVQFPNQDGCRHPVQLYGAAGRFLLLGYLLTLLRIKKWKDGFIFWNFVFFIGIGRFFVDFLRENIRLLGLSMGQYLSLSMVLVAGYVLWKYYRKEY